MHDAIPSRILNGWLRLEEDLFHLQVLSYLPPQIPICCTIIVFKLYHIACEQFNRNFGIYEKSPNSFLPGLPRSIVNQFCFHNFLCLRLASVHLPHPFHLVFGFQLFGHAVSFRQLRHDQLHAVSCRFVNLSAILSYVHPAIPAGAFFCMRSRGASPLFYSGSSRQTAWAAMPSPEPVKPRCSSVVALTLTFCSSVCRAAARFCRI